MGDIVRQDQEHPVTREHVGGRGGRLLGKSRILSLTCYYSTILLLRLRPHTLHTLGRNGSIRKWTHLPTSGCFLCPSAFGEKRWRRQVKMRKEEERLLQGTHFGKLSLKMIRDGEIISGQVWPGLVKKVNPPTAHSSPSIMSFLPR